MANIVGIQDLVDGPRHLHVKVDISGDGSGTSESVAIAEAALKNCGEFRLERVVGQLTGFTGKLIWDGTTPVTFLEFPADDQFDWDYARGVTNPGLTNPKVANYTGDVLLSISGLSAGDVGTLVFYFFKKRIP